MKTKNLLVFIIVMALFGSTPSAWAVWTGAQSGTTYSASGTGDYDYTNNWASATIDDSFSGVPLTGDLTVTLDAARTTVAGGLNLNYDGNYNLTLVGVTSSRILTLGGPVSADTVVGGKTITIGGGAGVSLSLGTVARTFTVGAGDTLVIANATANTTGGLPHVDLQEVLVASQSVRVLVKASLHARQMIRVHQISLCNLSLN